MRKPIMTTGGPAKREGTEPEESCINPYCKHVYIDKATVQLVCGLTGEMSKTANMRRKDCRSGKPASYFR